jgi:hypothetical protein
MPGMAKGERLTSHAAVDEQRLASHAAAAERCEPSRGFWAVATPHALSHHADGHELRAISPSTFLCVFSPPVLAHTAELAQHGDAC